jgi:hypothetical protein
LAIRFTPNPETISRFPRIRKASDDLIAQLVLNFLLRRPASVKLEHAARPSQCAIAGQIAAYFSLRRNGAAG